MPLITFDALDMTIDCPEGETVFAAARRQSVPIPTACVGRGTCGLCRVKILAGEANLPRSAKSRSVTSAIPTSSRSCGCPVSSRSWAMSLWASPMPRAAPSSCHWGGFCKVAGPGDAAPNESAPCPALAAPARFLLGALALSGALSLPARAGAPEEITRRDYAISGLQDAAALGASPS